MFQEWTPRSWPSRATMLGKTSVSVCFSLCFFVAVCLLLLLDGRKLCPPQFLHDKLKIGFIIFIDNDADDDDYTLNYHYHYAYFHIWNAHADFYIIPQVQFLLRECSFVYIITESISPRLALGKRHVLQLDSWPTQSTWRFCCCFYCFRWSAQIESEI